MKHAVKHAFLAVPLALGCATQSLPPGTPPPEYEQRVFEAWPKEPADAGSDAPSAPSEPLPAPAAIPSDAEAGDTDAGAH